jgi:soluble cytochrome b562
MPVSIASQVAVQTEILERMERRLEDDRKSLAVDRASSELARAAVSAELADIRHGQSDMVRRLDKIEPVTNLVTSVRSQITGGLILLGVIGGIAWGGVVFFKDMIMEWFR